MDALSVYAQHVVRNSQARDLALQSKTDEFTISCLQTVVMWPGILARLAGPVQDLRWLSYSFLAGRSLVRGNQSATTAESARLMRFLSQLWELGNVQTQRSATDPCDYVAAIWIDCPRYELPIDYKSWELPRLLEDAIQQLEPDFKIGIAVSFPSDLSTLPVGLASGL